MVAAAFGAASEEGQTYHDTGFIRDHLEHVGYGDIAQTFGYCQRCGSVLGQR